MEQQFGHLHRVGSWAELCSPWRPQSLVILQGTPQPLVGDASATKSSKVQSPEEQNKSEVEIPLLGCYTATSSQTNAREG